ncbi:Transcriptional regulator CRZ1 [Colletotrichum sp. SAR 10_70]|nr:Transcriptional regulator CRZ1 [Colletotrichum sp. SAR 10_71]KAI8176646.1 Transcriptional regulator CRZ1 [Colletotrichum sp. SAR 10_65]KAI8177647.1 Transcriptional regulator CRZ1 [Colletotrichum sp. SAR 10_70]KAJ5004925.1 Transcriptional regulator CRZ1 [Colletotrichum sp. SAR 10_66]
MASDNGPIATEAPLLAVSAPVASDAFALGGDPARSKSLKRARETTPTSPTSAAVDSVADPAAAAPVIAPFDFPSPTKSARFALASSRRSPTPLTAAAALEALDEERRREQRLNPPGSSDNPGHSVLSVLAGSVAAMSRPDDAPQAPTASMEASTKEPQPVSIPQPNNAPAENAEISPQSATSVASIAGALVTASPGPMEVDHKTNEQPQQQQQSQPQLQATPQPPHPATAQEDKTTPGSLSYPGSLQAAAMMPAPPARGMSFPMPSPGHESPTQSSGKKHKCPFCDTEFTRHHNLKSHLLTHSQEKPYICQECSMRFRRLHDLKRHSKLHTGEKPHVCPKCDRKFARGDALARHSKGAGGCAGRRSSMGSFAETDDMDGPSMADGDDSMAGVVYGNEEDMTEEERRLSLPSIKAQHVAGQGSMEGMPNSITGGHTPNTSVSSMPPLSPGTAHDTANIARQRSPSLTQQFQQQQFGRRPSERNTSPVFAAPAGAHARGAGSGTENGNNMFATDPGLWAYVQNLEEKVKQLSDKITAFEKADTAKQAQIGLLTSEVTGLKKQLEAREAETTEVKA